MSTMISNQKLSSSHTLNVYLMKIPEHMDISQVIPPEREIQLRNTTNEKKRLERYAVWTLLEKAVYHSFGLKMEELSFSLSNGKWSCDKLYFSLSHSHGAAAVALSDLPCGVDIENLDKFTLRHRDTASIESLLSRISTENEVTEFSSAQEALSLWTKKESIFKCYGSEQFLSRKIDSRAYRSETVPINLDEEYILSVCADELNCLRYFVLEDGKFSERTF